MQKFVTLFIAFILSVFPIVNASASPHSCGNMMPATMAMSDQMSESQSMNESTTVDSANMASMHDCCEKPDKICDHSNACDCENTQVNYTSVTAFNSQYLQIVDRLKFQYLPSLFTSKHSDSLYRPPINTFI